MLLKYLRIEKNTEEDTESFVGLGEYFRVDVAPALDHLHDRLSELDAQDYDYPGHDDDSDDAIMDMFRSLI